MDERNVASGGTRLNDKVDTIAGACAALSANDLERASEIINAEYPFTRRHSTGRSYTPLQSMRVFLRDGFIDRYSGTRLVHPAALRLLAILIPQAFPAHPNWKMNESHIAFWELFPTIDHVVPVARGGADGPENWICTSMLKNQAKSHWTLEELGWCLHPRGDIQQWDGLTRWFVEYVETHISVRDEAYIDKWYRASCRALAIA